MSASAPEADSAESGQLTAFTARSRSDARSAMEIGISQSLIADRGAVASGISPADERAVSGIDKDTVDMACPFVPVAPAIKDMSPLLEL